jgi:hypothetical protein
LLVLGAPEFTRVKSGNTNSTIQACVSGQSNCGGKFFPSGRAVIEIEPLAAGGNVFQVTVKELNIDCQDAPGVSGLSVIAGQEETVFDLVRASGCRVAGFDIGQGDKRRPERRRPGQLPGQVSERKRMSDRHSGKYFECLARCNRPGYRANELGIIQSAPGGWI